MAKSNKPLNKWGPGPGRVGRQESERQNNYDRPSAENPNAMGPTMKPPYDECARPASHFADQHDEHEVQIPRVMHGIVSGGFHKK